MPSFGQTATTVNRRCRKQVGPAGRPGLSQASQSAPRPGMPRPGAVAWVLTSPRRSRRTPWGGAEVPTGGRARPQAPPSPRAPAEARGQQIRSKSGADGHSPDGRGRRHGRAAAGRKPSLRSGEGRAVVLSGRPGPGERGGPDHPRGGEASDERLMALMIRECSGIVCLCIDQETRPGAWTCRPWWRATATARGPRSPVSIEARDGVTTGVLGPRPGGDHPHGHPPRKAAPGDLLRPGDVFPLAAHPGGLHVPPGPHGRARWPWRAWRAMRPAAVQCELMNPDGTMMRGAALAPAFAQLRVPPADHPGPGGGGEPDPPAHRMNARTWTIFAWFRWPSPALSRMRAGESASLRHWPRNATRPSRRARPRCRGPTARRRPAPERPRLVSRAKPCRGATGQPRPSTAAPRRQARRPRPTRRRRESLGPATGQRPGRCAHGCHNPGQYPDFKSLWRPGAERTGDRANPWDHAT